MKTYFKKHLKLIIALLVVTISSVGYAQKQGHNNGPRSNRQGPPPIPDATQIQQMVSDLSTELKLSKEQTTKITALYTDHFKQVKQKIEEQRPKHEEMEALKKSFESSVKKALTSEQQTGYNSFLKKKPVRKNQEQQKKPNK